MKNQTFHTYYCDSFITEFEYCIDKKEAIERFKLLYKAEGLDRIFGEYYPELLTVSSCYLGKWIGE